MDSEPGTPIDLIRPELSGAKQKVNVQNLHRSRVEPTGDAADRMESKGKGDARHLDNSSAGNGECDVRMDGAKDLTTNGGKTFPEDGEQKGISATVERGRDRSVIEGKRAKEKEEKKVMEERKERVDQAAAGKKKEEIIRSDEERKGTDENKRSYKEGIEESKESNKRDEKENESRRNRNLAEGKTPVETGDDKTGERGIECKQEGIELKVDKRNEPETKEDNVKQNEGNEVKAEKSGATESEINQVEAAQTTDKRSERMEKTDAGTYQEGKEEEDDYESSEESIEKVVEVNEENRKEKETAENMRKEGVLSETGEGQERNGKLDEKKEIEEKSTEKRAEGAKEEDANDGNDMKEKLKLEEGKEGNKEKEEVEREREAEENGKGVEYDKPGESGDGERRDSEELNRRCSVMSQEEETVRRSSIESRWRLGRKLGQGASTALDMDQCDPPTCVSLLRTPSPKIYSSLNRKLKGCDQSWMKGFLEEGGLDALLTSVNAISSRKIQLADAMMLLECVACVKTVMNSKIGLQVITERQEYAEILLAGKYSLVLGAAWV